MPYAKKLISISFWMLLGGATACVAQPWPTQTVRIVVGFGPGSSPDILARTIANDLSMRLNVPFVVENKGGAGGTLGVADVARAKPDGLTLGLTIPGPLVVNPMTMQLPYDPKTDLAPITIIATQPTVLVASAKMGVSTVGELIAKLKEKPGQYNYASIGIGSVSHTAIELMAQASSVQVTHIPYKGSPDAVTALVAGDAHFAALPPIAVLEQARAGTLRLLAVSMPQRWQILPDVPTFAEAGLPEEVPAQTWGALIAPARTPELVIEKIYTEVRATLAKPDVQEQMKRLLLEPVGNSPKEFAAVLRDEDARWSGILKKLGLKTN